MGADGKDDASEEVGNIKAWTESSLMKLDLKTTKEQYNPYKNSHIKKTEVLVVPFRG